MGNTQVNLGKSPQLWEPLTREPAREEREGAGMVGTARTRNAVRALVRRPRGGPDAAYATTLTEGLSGSKDAS